MGDKTSIEWTRGADGSKGATWNPIRARNKATGKMGWHCAHVSPGCINCYAENINKRLGTALPFKPSHERDIEIFLDEAMLFAPLRWKRPRNIFVGSMTDLFADFVTDSMLDRVFAVMALAPWHVYQVLTKRSARMRRWANDPDTPRRIEAWITAIAQTPSRRKMAPALASIPLGKVCIGLVWPLPNVWLGVSAEDQQRADERRDDLAVLAAQGWTTFVSYEPALGSVDWTGWDFLKWFIGGGESGRDARPSHPDWHRAARDFCGPRGVAYFFKQWGEWICADGVGPDHPELIRFQQEIMERRPDLVRSGDGVSDSFARVGKRRAGRRLDGVEHNAFPEMAK